MALALAVVVAAMEVSEVTVYREVDMSMVGCYNYEPILELIPCRSLQRWRQQ